jgi:BolA family transcriptional regulator, general stress-responsive regulator
MTLLTQEITERLQTFTPISLNIVDESAMHAGHSGNNGGGHFKLYIVSEAFKVQTSVARHRSIYETLADLMPNRIHALSITALTPEEVQQIK